MLVGAIDVLLLFAVWDFPMNSGLLSIIYIAFLYNASKVISVVNPVWPMVAMRKQMSTRLIVLHSTTSLKR